MKRRKSVVFVVSNFFLVGGAERATSILSSELTRHGFDVIILSISGRGDDFPFQASSDVKIECLGCTEPTSGVFSKFINILLLLIQSQKIRSFLKKTGPEFAIGVGIVPSIQLIISSVFLQIKIFAWEHLSFVAQPAQWKFLRKILYRFTDAVIALTERDVSDLKAVAANVRVIQNPIYSTQQKPESTDKRLPKILAIGRLVPQKGFSRMLAMWKIISPQLAGWSLHIIGDGPERSILESIHSELDLGGSCFFEGQRHDVPELLRESSVLVLPSIFEGLPMVLLEALAAGTPIVSFDCPTGPREILNSGEFGILVQDKNEAEFCRKLVSLARDNSLRSRLSVLGKARALHYSPSSVAKEWISLFEGAN